MRASTPSTLLLSASLIMFNLFSSQTLHAQRLTLPELTPTSSSTAPSPSTPSPQTITASTSYQEDQVLKTYPDGTKRVVPLSSLNFRDDGESFGGPPQLSVIPNSAIPTPPASPKLFIAPIGHATTPPPAPAPLPPAIIGRADLRQAAVAGRSAPTGRVSAFASTCGD